MTDLGRSLVVVDIETTGLTDSHVPLEVAVVDPADTARYFVPYIPSGAIADAYPDALRINRYFERGVYKHELSQPKTREEYFTLHKMLSGNVLGGANPRFDAGMLSRVFTAYGLPPEPWHHRLGDISVYAAGILGLKITKIPGLHAVCEMLGVPNPEAHSALSDARATADCFRILGEQ